VLAPSQIIVGAEVGVGLCEGSMGISWRVLLKTFAGWVWTILLSMSFCAALFSAGVCGGQATRVWSQGSGVGGKQPGFRARVQVCGASNQ
jgi:hypothetical protein